MPQPASIRFAFLTAATFLLCGCAVSRLAPAPSASAAAPLSGRVHGGQQPVSGASIQLYAVGTTGYGSASTPLLQTPATTDGNGAFSITGEYTCPSADAQVYLTATGGNPGFVTRPGLHNQSNGAIALVTALGSCSSLSASTQVTLNEVTTVAAAWALAPFASDVADIGSSATNAAGLATAMQTAALLADSAVGVSPSTTLPTNASVESAKIYALANLIATCVNSDGRSICSSLFADATSPAATLPTDSFSLALNIARNPTYNVSTLFDDVPPETAFPQMMQNAPADWSLSIAYTGGGLNAPTSVAIDGAGNPWVASYGGALSSFSPQGAPVWQNGLTGAGLNQSVALAIDRSSQLWVANMASGALNNYAGSVSLISAGGNILSGATGISTGAINLPSDAAADTDGSLWVTNLGSSSVSRLASDGSALASNLGSGFLAAPSALALDLFHNAWIVNRATGSLTRMDNGGNILHQTTMGNTPDSIALDANGSAWVGDNSAGTLTHVGFDGALLALGLTGGGLDSPRTLAIDAGNHLWATNSASGVVAEFSTGNSTAGTALTPASGIGADIAMQQPFGAAVDASGNLWVSSVGDNRLIAFVGLATPTQTPKFTLPKLP